MVNHQVSLLNLTIETDIPGDVINYRLQAYCVCAAP